MQMQMIDCEKLAPLLTREHNSGPMLGSIMTADYNCYCYMNSRKIKTQARLEIMRKDGLKGHQNPRSEPASRHASDYDALHIR